MPKARRRGNYLKAADIGGRGGTAIVRFVEAGERNITDYRKDGALEIPVTPVKPPEWTTGGSDPKTWSLNRTSEDTVRDHLGEDTEGWVNQVTCVNVLPQNVRGQMRDVLYSEAPTPEEQPKERAPPTATPAAATPATATPPAIGAAITYTEAETRYLQYNEILIETILDPQDWQSMPKGVKAGLQAKGVLIDQDGYPYLTKDARKALE